MAQLSAGLCWEYIVNQHEWQQNIVTWLELALTYLTFMKIESLAVCGVLILQSRSFAYFPVPCCESECLDMLTVATVVRLALGLP